MSGRQGFVGGVASNRGNTSTLTQVMLRKLIYLSAGEESGIPSVAVKCVDIRRKISGEGDFLDCN